MIFLALIAPEAIFALAPSTVWCRSILSSKWECITFTRGITTEGTYVAHELSMTHGFFIVMGGFVTKDGNHPITTTSLATQYKSSIEAVRDEEIADKSKSDLLAKALTVVQLFFFIGVYGVRVKEGLQISALETSTLGLAVIQCLTGFFWLKKPQRVGQAIAIDFGHPSCPESKSTSDDTPNQNSERGQNDTTTLPGPFRAGGHTNQAESWCLTAVRKALNGAMFGRYDFDPMAASCVPRFWSGDIEHNLHLFWQLLCAVLLGGVHLLAWSTKSTFFPSFIEMWLWRICALILAASPILCVLLLLIKNCFNTGSDSLRALFACLPYGIAALYLIARATLLILSFTTLRGAPTGILIDVNWRF
ncbi:hypothetical protein MSAN_02446500 [Mycena sanguinolenta]|uniref:Integral membrane protein n=1 Tax=Mycena sanguinolenta TaxID=230812 RepID=A0A8H6WYC2_9AGAR|nr:hypothetical protein MSAN_02446500 [Mycena sanguinolenta]